MLLVLGNSNCSRCEVVKTILTNKGIEFRYELMEDLPSGIKGSYMKMAREAKMLSMPILIQGGKVMSIENCK